MSQTATVFFFTLSILVASMTMFLLEPAIGKSFLPVLGGTPAVWNACVLFFQFTLLAGYLYAHFLSTRVPPKLQVFIHTAVVWLPIFTLPLRKPKAIPLDQDPTLWLLMSLPSSVGAVFFVTTTTTPLMQKWYSRTDSWLASDPYFLYAASNCGSMVGLIAYPFLVEPMFGLTEQLELLSICYIIYACIITQCGRIVFNTRFATLDLTDDKLEENRSDAGASTISNLSEAGQAEPFQSEEFGTTTESGTATEASVTATTEGDGRNTSTNQESNDEESKGGADTTGSEDERDKKEELQARNDEKESIETSTNAKLSKKAKRRLKEQAAREARATAMGAVTREFRDDNQPDNDAGLLQQLQPQAETEPDLHSEQSKPDGSRADSNGQVDEALPANAEATAQKSVITPPTANQYGRWLLLSLLPSSLMLAVTTFITQELSSFPLLWVIPLAIYLSTFMIAFSRIPNKVLVFFRVISPLIAVAPLVLLVAQPGTMAVHYLALFVLCMGCHGTLALERPHPRYLTNFYLTMSVGGVLGSSFNTLVAPVVFKELLEYPLVLSLTAIVLLSFPKILGKRKPYSPGVAKCIPPAIVVGCYAIGFLAGELGDKIEASKNPGGTWELVYLMGVFILPMLLTCILARNATQMRWGMAAISFTVLLNVCNPNNWIVYKCRNFFGTKQIRVDAQITLINGLTTHGSEYLDPDRRGVPTSYYAPDSAVGEIMDTVYGKTNAEPLGVVGMGAGVLGAYMKPKQPLIYYEIDPDVIRLATDPFYFTYLWRAHKRGVQIDIVPGDGRLSLEQEKDKFFRTIVLDAYSSDAIPTHLITKEAIMLYMRKLKDDGILAVHVSNRYFDLREVLVYEADELHLNCLWKYKESTNKVASVWVILTRDAKLTEAFKKLNFQQVWGRADANHRLWTDDYSSPLSVMHTDMW